MTAGADGAAAKIILMQVNESVTESTAQLRIKSSSTNVLTQSYSLG